MKGSVIPLVPNNVVIMGGGRWARVYIDILLELLPLSCRVLVYSPRNCAAMAVWIAGKGIGKQVSVIGTLPMLSKRESNFVVVVNAAADHEKSIKWALSQHAAVLVEKPLTLNSTALRLLIAEASQRGVYFAAAHVFLFAEYLINFKTKIKLKEIKSLDVIWADAAAEARHGEVKTFDPGVRIFEDCLPHVLSMINLFEPGRALQLVQMELRRGGAELDVILSSAQCRYRVRLIRNGKARRRVIIANGMDECATLDFSKEPGTISTRSQVKEEASLNWATSKKPLYRMLEAFFHAAISGGRDERLATSLGLRSVCLSEEIVPLYQTAQAEWLAQSMLAAADYDDNDVSYAIREIAYLYNSHAMPLSKAVLSSLAMEIKSFVKDASSRKQFVTQPVDFVKSVLIRSREN